MKKNILKICFLVLLAVSLLPLGQAYAEICNGTHRYGFVDLDTVSGDLEDGKAFTNESKTRTLTIGQGSICDIGNFEPGYYYSVGVITGNPNHTVKFHQLTGDVTKGQNITRICENGTCCYLSNWNLCYDWSGRSPVEIPAYHKRKYDICWE